MVRLSLAPEPDLTWWHLLRWDDLVQPCCVTGISGRFDAHVRILNIGTKPLVVGWQPEDAIVSFVGRDWLCQLQLTQLIAVHVGIHRIAHCLLKEKKMVIWSQADNTQKLKTPFLQSLQQNHLTSEPQWVNEQIPPTYFSKHLFTRTQETFSFVRHKNCS